MKSWLAALVAAIAASIPVAALAQQEGAPRVVEYADHDGTKLSGDLYLPKGATKAPVIVAVHGGGWQNGNRAGYKYWGPFLAKNGYALFAISYRLGKPGMYPRAVYDVKSAIQFVRAKAADLNVDPDRIGLWGDSAGGQLVDLVALAGDEFKSEYRNDPNAGTPANVKSVIAFYGVQDMLAQWNHDQLARPRDNIAEKFLGASPQQNRRIYFESSPISYATVDRTRSRFLLVHGTHDDIVDPAQQEAFWMALNQAGIFARRIIIPGAGHFFNADPFEGDPTSYGAIAAPRILRFLQDAL
jgi:acetyl esterase/lipase